MNKITFSTRLFLAIVMIATFSAAALADTLRLKDGSIIKGRIVSFGGGKFVVVVGDGTRQRQMSFDASEIESIQFETLAARVDTARSDPEFIETSAPPKSVPRVISAENSTASKQPVVKNPPPNEPVQSSSPQVVQPTRPAGAKPVEVSVKVLADNTGNGWTNSGWVVRKGQKIRIIGGGNISVGKGKATGPSGLYDLEDPNKLLKSVPTGALIAVIGDDNNEFIYIGSERTFTASRDGALFLGVNEGNLEDNSGSFDVRIEIEPA